MTKDESFLTELTVFMHNKQTYSLFQQDQVNMTFSWSFVANGAMATTPWA